MKNILIAGLVTLVGASPLLAAPFTDDFANTDNIVAFGNISDSATAGILTLTRTIATGDAGIDWLINGTDRFSLNGMDQQSILEITPDAAIGDGTWNVNILFFDALGGFISEDNLIAFSSSTAFTSNDIADFAVSVGATNAATYQPRIRIQGDVNSGFDFSQFAAVPEPGQYALMLSTLLAAGTLVYRRRRQA